MPDQSATQRDRIEELADSFVTRFRTGERPSVEEFAGRYPDMASELRELLPALVLLEQNASSDDTAAFTGEFSRGTVPREIGDFAIVREIARGGMGIVYEAIQQSLGRHVALKVLNVPGLLNPAHLERFRLEARAAARLHHTHIVPVFGVGEHKGLHYYAMQFIQGQSLDLVIDAIRQLRHKPDTSLASPVKELSRSVADGLMTGHFPPPAEDSLEKNPEPPHTSPLPEPGTLSSTAASPSEYTSGHQGREFYRSVARVGLQVTEALAYAHSEGILHRDIKPSNLLVDARGNVWVTDFGLAKTEGVDGLTQTGDFVGTLRYMPPERLEGWSDRRSDLYSLGATLYELLVLRPFLDCESRGRLIDRILHDNPAPPSKFDHHVPRDLETIILKAINKEPAARYRTAEEMAEDLRRFLADRPVLARRSTSREQIARWCRRNPAVAGLLATVFTLLVGGIAISSYFASSASRQARLADVARSQAEAQGKRAAAVSAYFMDDVVGLADPKRYDQAGISLVGALDIAANNIDARFPNDPDLRADIRHQLGEIYFGIDQPQQAVDQLEQAVELRQTLFGPQDPKTLESRGRLGHAQYMRGRFVEARGALEDVWSEQCKVLGPADPATLRTAGILCIVLMEVRNSLPELKRDDRDLKISESSYRAALARYGARDPFTLEAESTYAWVLRWRQHVESPSKILDLTREAALGLHETCGPDDVRTMYASYNYGCALYESGHFKDAAQEFKSLLQTRIRVLGRSHVDTMHTVWRAANSHREAGDPTNAIAVLDEFCDHLDETHITENVRRARPLYVMAATYEDLGCVDQAARLQTIVYQSLTKRMGQQQSDTVVAEWMCDLAARMTQSKHPTLRDGERIVELATKACEYTNYQNPRIVGALAAAHAEKGNCSLATKWFDRALQLDANNPELHYFRAVNHLQGGDLAGYSAGCLAMAAKCAAESEGRASYFVAWTCGLSAAFTGDLKVPLNRIDELVREQPKDPDYLTALGLLLYRSGQFEEAAVHLNSAITVNGKEVSDGTPATYARFLLAMAKWKLGRKAEAQRHLGGAQEAMDLEMLTPPAWNRRVTLEIFRRESEALIQPAESSTQKED